MKKDSPLKIEITLQNMEGVRRFDVFILSLDDPIELRRELGARVLGSIESVMNSYRGLKVFVEVSRMVDGA